MAKIKLGARPVNFKRVIKVPMHDGEEGFMEVLYKYRTLSQFGAFVDEYAKYAADKLREEHAAREAAKRDAEARGEKYVEPDLTEEEQRQKQAEATADYLMRILDGWFLEVEFSPQAVLQLCDELPGAASQIVTDYRLAIVEGRLGN